MLPRSRTSSSTGPSTIINRRHLINSNQHQQQQDQNLNSNLTTKSSTTTTSRQTSSKPLEPTTAPTPSTLPPTEQPPIKPKATTTTSEPKAKLTELWGSPPKIIKKDSINSSSSNSSTNSGSNGTGCTYLIRGKLLGEGGFARVYLVTESNTTSVASTEKGGGRGGGGNSMQSNEVRNNSSSSGNNSNGNNGNGNNGNEGTGGNGNLKAVKVISKQQLKSSKNKSKLFGEIKIHQAMNHPNIIQFEQCFEDDGNVYMQLELCSHGSLLDLLRLRKKYSEPEARFYLVQLIGAVEYMHRNSVIHRDLKLGNLMLDSEMNLRVGDFGLAALVRFPGERKKTICGTPNYIAPEILFDTTNGHSFEVDIWSIGVILYTLLIGKPPFQTRDVKSIYRKIKENAYTFPSPSSLSPESTLLISSILTTSPLTRPSLSEILKHPWFITGPFPPFLTEESLVGIPDFRGVSVRGSHRNFKNVREGSGLKEEEGRVVSTRDELGVVREEEEEEGEVVEIQLNEVTKSTSTTTTTKVEQLINPQEQEEQILKTKVEKELQIILSPNSPICELLKSARKPLMISPSSNQPSHQQRSSNGGSGSRGGGSGGKGGIGGGGPKEVLQKKLQEEAFGRLTSSSSTTNSNGGGGNLFSAGRSTGASGGNSKTTSSSINNNVKPTTSSTTNLVAQNQNSVPPSTSGGRVGRTVTSSVGNGNGISKNVGAVPELISTRYPSQQLYTSTYLTLHTALTISSTHQLEALPNPVPLIGPKVFITSWVDYTHKYGTAYSLTDGTAGVYFNDSTSAVLAPDKIHFDYISNKKANIYSRKHFKTKSYPEELERKVYLLEYFQDYMYKTLMREVDWNFKDLTRERNLDFLVKYYRMKNAIVFKLSNEVLQFNFYDHTKLLLTQNGQIITFIDKEFNLTTYSLLTLFHEASRLGYYRASPDPNQDPRRKLRLEGIKFLVEKLEYCRDVLKSLSERKSGGAAAGGATGGGAEGVRK